MKEIIFGQNGVYVMWLENLKLISFQYKYLMRLLYLCFFGICTDNIISMFLYITSTAFYMITSFMVSSSFMV